MSLLKKLAGETAVYGLSSILGRVLNYLLVPIYTRVFATGEYGIVSELYAWAGFLMVFFIMRMETAFFRFGTNEENRKASFSTAWWSVLAGSLVLSLSIVGFSSQIGAWFEYRPDQYSYIAMFGLILAFDTLAEIPLAKLRLEHKAIRFATVRLVGIGLNVALNLFFLLLCPWLLRQGIATGLVESIYRPSFGVGYVFLSNLIASAAVLLLLLPELKFVEWRFDKALWRTMFAYSAPLVLASLAGIANEMLDRVLLRHLLPGTMEENLSQVGIYSACYKLAMLMSLFTQAFRYAAEPFFFANANHRDARYLYGQVAKYFTIAGAMAFLVIMLYLDVVKQFIDEPYWEGLGVVPILLLANLFLGLYYNVSIWYKLTDHTMLGGWIAVGGAIITVSLNVYWIPKTGYIGSAWATLICYASMTAASWWWGRRYYPVQYNWARMLGYVLLALAVYSGTEYLIKNLEMSTAPAFALRTSALLAWLAIVWSMERKELFVLLRKSS